MQGDCFTLTYFSILERFWVWPLPALSEVVVALLPLGSVRARHALLFAALTC